MTTTRTATRDCQVLVVGAGPTGLTLAAQLLARGVQARVIDKAEEPEKMIKQVILDMQNQLLQVKTQVAITIADQHVLEKKQQEAEE